jgi:hypothetical protein
MKQKEIFNLFSHFGYFGFVIVSQNSKGIEVITLGSVKGELVTYRNISDAKIIFSDKLKNLNGRKYNIPLFHQPPNVVIEKNKPRTPLTHFLTSVASIQNTSINFIVLKRAALIKNYWMDRTMDLTFNSAFSHPESQYPKLLTYDETAYCAFAPVNSKHKLYRFILFEPFESITWMLLILTIVSCVAVWKLFRGHGAVDSHWLVGVAISATFINQGVNFSNRNHTVLNILFHLIIFLIFVLSNAYEGAITSFMIQPPPEHRLETFDQILASDYDIMTDGIFSDAVSDSKDFMAIKSRINDSIRSLGMSYGTEIKRQHYVFIMQCDQAELELKRKFPTGEKISDYYYLLPERIMKNFVRLEASYLNPFIERLQYYMNLCFQAGLPQIWKIHTSKDVMNNPNQQSSIEEDLLNLESMKIVFAILLAGLSTSLLILLCEIFYQNCLRNLNIGDYGRQLRNKINQMAYKKKRSSYPRHVKVKIQKKVKRLKPEKLNVRTIFVQPRNVEN